MFSEVVGEQMRVEIRNMERLKLHENVGELSSS